LIFAVTQHLVLHLVVNWEVFFTTNTYKVCKFDSNPYYYCWNKESFSRYCFIFIGKECRCIPAI